MSATIQLSKVLQRLRAEKKHFEAEHRQHLGRSVAKSSCDTCQFFWGKIEACDDLIKIFKFEEIK